MRFLKRFVSFLTIFVLILPANATYVNKIDVFIYWDFFIENDLTETNSINITLNNNIAWATQMKFWNSIAERDLATFETFSTTKSRNLSLWEWKKTVYASFKNASWDIVNIEDDIIYKITPNLPYSTWLTLWFDSKDVSSISEVSWEISQWNDKSWNNYHAIQDTALEKPNLLTDEIDFNWTSEYFYLKDLNYSNISPLDWLLVCWVFKTNHVSSSYNDNWALLDFDRSEWFDFYNKWWDYWFSFDSDWTIRDITTSWVWINDNSWHVACASYDNSIINDTVITINWNTEYSWNVEPNWAQIWVWQATRYWFIWDWSEAWSEDAWRNNIYYDWWIWEMIYFDSAVSSSDRKDLECYLWEKWWVNVSWCLDSFKPIATIQYSPETVTTWFVNAKLINESEDIIITNNSWSDTFTFLTNGSFTFEYVDNNWNTGSTIATVDWIDSSWLPSIWTGSENTAPEITSFSGSSSVDLYASSWSLDVAIVSAIDNSYNVVWEFWKTTLSWNSRTDIWHYEMCSPAVTVSHRWNVAWEIQRAPRVKNKTWTWFQVRVNNYNSTIWSLNTNIDYLVFNSWTYDFSWLKVQAWSALVSTVACNTSNNPWTATSISFNPNFSSAPSILHTISTENDSSWVVSWVNWNDWTRQSEPTNSIMWMILQRSFNSCTHSPENIDYIAFEPWHYSTTLWFEVDAVRSTDSIHSITTTWDPIDYFSAFPYPPWVALVSQLWEDWWNWWYWQIHIWWWVLANKLYATTDEDWPSADRTHTQEVFSSVAFSSDSWQFVEDNILTYSIDSWNDASDFQIDPNLWTLKFITSKSPWNPTDSNSDWVYEVTVKVCDSHCNSKCSYQSFNVDVSDTVSPVVSWINFSSGSLVPGWFHNFLFSYFDDAIWIDINSDNISLEKRNWSSWWWDISSIYLWTWTISQTWAVYPSIDLDYWKYKLSFNISDNNWNISDNYDSIFYIDKPQFIVSTWSVDIWALNHLNNTFAWDINLTVKTLWAPFIIKLKKNQALSQWIKIIPYYDWSSWFWYDKNDDGNLFDFNDDIISQEIQNINISWNLNTYNYTLKLWAIIEELQSAWEYQANIDFLIEFEY